MGHTLEDIKTWLKTHIEDLSDSFTPEQFECIAQMLVYSKEFEEYLYLNFPQYSAVISLNKPTADIEILSHYGERGIKEYTSFISDTAYFDFCMALRITKVCFTTQADSAEKIMSEDVRKELVASALLRDSVQYKFITNGKLVDLVFAWRNVPKAHFMHHVAMLCLRHNLHIHRLRFAYTDPLTTKSILIGSLELEGENVQDERKRLGFMREFEMQKFLRECPELDRLVAGRVLTGNQEHLIRIIAGFCEQILTHVNSAMYTEDACQEAFAFHPELTTKLIRVFRLKFHPQKHDIAKYREAKDALYRNLVDLDTGRKVHDDRRRMIFQLALSFVDSCLKTNVYEYHKLGLAFRLTPAFMDQIAGFDRKSVFPELPYGIFYISSWNYTAFHIRFRELARGGVRTIVTRDAEHCHYERANAFFECYNLAYIQQMKNKDIPEGGSKTVIFLLPNVELERDVKITRNELKAAGKSEEEIKHIIEKYIKEQGLEYMYYNQRCFLNTFLTMLVWDDAANKLKYGNVIDYLGKKEFIYLGPDENMHDCLINWTANESKRLGYSPIMGAFISGKRSTGMNHKEYGVTSLGILQFVKTCVTYLNLPSDFTIKISGGPDGDVAGNMIRLLGTHYPQSKLVTVTDGFGACYDPEGMDYKKLTEMFYANQAIDKYPPELLHEGGWLLTMWRTRQQNPFVKETALYRKTAGKLVQEWVPSSQAMKMFSTNAHVHTADIFVPCGGRPRTLAMGNITDFIGADGKPTARAICEGANLYITSEARAFLEDKGVLLFKDSSANKCGVISSSYEILAGLILDDETYLRVKPELAKCVLVKLEKLAHAEAQVMLSYWLAHDKKIQMSKISMMVSTAINKYADQISAYLEDKDISQPEFKRYYDVYINYIPDVLKRENMNAVEHVIPDHHKKRIVATYIARKLIYEKGIDWQPSIVDVLPVLAL